MSESNQFPGLRGLAQKAAFVPLVPSLIEIWRGDMIWGLSGIGLVVLLLFWSAPDAREELSELIRSLYLKIHLTGHDLLWFAVVSLVFNVIVVALPAYTAEVRLKSKAAQLSRDLGEFFGKQMEETQQWVQHETAYKREFAVRVQVMCDQLKDHNLLNIKLQQLCAAPSQSAAVHWEFQQFGTVVDQLPNLASVFTHFHLIRVLGYWLGSILLWGTFVELNTRAIEKHAKASVPPMPETRIQP
jgi:hypothetical protein